MRLEIKFIASMAKQVPSHKKVAGVIRNQEALAGRNISLIPLKGGNLNHVWRASDEHGNTVIAKYAPPFIAKKPEIPLDDSRIHFESRILKAFRDDERLGRLPGLAIRVPEFRGFDKKENILLMEDVGDLENIIDYMFRSSGEAGKMGKELGNFIAGLHLQTFGDQGCREKFNNLPVQETRFEVQYQQCGTFAQKGGMSPKRAAEVDTHCRALGNKLMDTGVCLIMGDLWPESILVDSNSDHATLVLIDWEMSHYGNPVQDVAHLDAHLWMMQHRCQGEEKRREIGQFQEKFTGQYRKKTEQDAAFARHVKERDYAIHYGAEILARTTGSFQAGYLYDGLNCNDKPIQEAVSHAVRQITAN